MERSITRKCSGGKLVKVTVSSSGKVVQRVRITGDFFVHPESAMDKLEERLAGVGRGQIAKVVMEVLGEGPLVIGFNAKDMIIMIEECLG